MQPKRSLTLCCALLALSLIWLSFLGGGPPLAPRPSQAAPAAPHPMAASQQQEPDPGIVLGVYLEPTDPSLDPPGQPYYADTISQFQQRVGRRHEIIMYFAPWEEFDTYLLDQLSGINITPLIVWEPRGISLADVADGGLDDYLRRYAQGLRTWGHPIMLSPAHDPNVALTPWYAPPDTYKAAWRRIVTVFREEGATNVQWVWTVSPVSSPATPENAASLFYPGDDVVDWVGVKGLNWGPERMESSYQWQPADALVGAALQEFACLFAKPQMLVGLGTVDSPGYSKGTWLRDAYTRLPDYPFLHAVVYFNQFAFNDPDDADFRITTNPRYPVPLDSGYAVAYGEAISTSAYLSEMPDYSTLVPAERFCPENTCIPRTNQVTLYPEDNYGGACVVKDAGDYPNPAALGLPDNALASLKVGGSVRALLCQEEGFAGLCEPFGRDDPTLGDNPIGGDVSSLKVESRAAHCMPGANQVALYAMREYGGTCVVKDVGEYPDAAALGLADNSVSSVRVGPKAQALLCRDTNYGGICETLNNDDSNLEDNSIGTNHLSSLKVLPQPLACLPTENQVALYADRNYRGQCVLRESGVYTDATALGLPDDTVTSLLVGAGVRVTLCPAPALGGACQTFTSDTPNLINSTVGNNQASSMRVEARPAAPAHPVVLGVYLEPTDPSLTPPGQPFYSQTVATFNQTVGKPHGLVMFPAAWEEFDAYLLDQLHQVDATPLIAWNPVGISLADVAGGAHDEYLRRYARAVRNWGHPLLLSPASEPNVSTAAWYTTPDVYVAAWRHIVGTFREEQVTNVRWVWTVRSVSLPPTTENAPTRYYPGDDVVDWVGVTGFNIGPSEDGVQRWQSAEEIFSKALYDLACAFPKPQMVVGMGSVDAPGYSKRDWIEAAYQRLRDYPFLHAVVYFNHFAFSDPNAADFRITINPRYPVPLDEAYAAAYGQAIAPDWLVSDLPAYESLVPEAPRCQVYLPALAN